MWEYFIIYADINVQRLELDYFNAFKRLNETLSGVKLDAETGKLHTNTETH